MALFVLPHDGGEGGAWFRALRRALAERPLAASLAVADVVLHGQMVPHYPAFLEEALAFPGGVDGFFVERMRRMEAFFRNLTERLLPALSPAQRLVLIDLETDYNACSAHAHACKRRLAAGERRLVHASICATTANYRPGVDISYPAVLPSALGSAAARRVPPSSRPLLLSFKGRRTHRLRRAIFSMHNEAQRIVCIDSTEERAASRERLGPGAPDASAIALHGASVFSLCPRGDAPYSYRLAEALSCGSIPVVLGDGWVLPFSEHPDVDYAAFAVCIPEAEVHRTPETCAAIPEARRCAMQAEGRRVFEERLCGLPAQLDTLLEIVMHRRRLEEVAAQSGAEEHQVCDRLAGKPVPRAAAPAARASLLPPDDGGVQGQPRATCESSGGAGEGGRAGPCCARVCGRSAFRGWRRCSAVWRAN